MSLIVAAACDCGAPMLSTGWIIVAAVVALLGSAVAVARSGRAPAGHRHDGVEGSEPRPEGGQEGGRHDQAGDVELASPSSQWAVGVSDEVVDTRSPTRT